MKVFIFVTVLSLFASSCFAADSICEGVPSGSIYLFPYPGDCTKFYECENGQATPHNCPSGEWFNEALQACDHPDASGCNNVACPPGVVDFFPAAGDCTEYIECYHGALELHTCPDGLWFNSVEKRCVSAEQSGCGQYTNPPTWETPEPDCYGVRPGFILLKPYPGNCNKFIECIGATATVMSCPPYLYFDYNRQMCDQKDISGCDDTTGTPAPPYSTITPPPAPFEDPRCADGNNDYWPDVDCHLYVECYGGHGYSMECPSGLYFDEFTKKCVDPSESECGRGTQTPYPTRSTNPDWTPDPWCPYPTPDRYLYAYPGDCTKFLECITGELIVQDCPPDLWFNPTLMVCDYPYESGCIYQ